MKPPVFIVGCPRSGTSFLYNLLLSSGSFAEFHTQMNVFDVLEPIYGDLSVTKNAKKMMQAWLLSKAFRASGLQANEIEAKVVAECHGASDFLRIVMDEVARKQRTESWIDSTPTNIPHMLRIHRDLPEARFIHILRDPRNVALSLDARGWTRPLPWDKSRSLLAAGLYWEWIVRKARKYGSRLGPQYVEVRYEELISNAHETLAKLSPFLKQELDYRRIAQGGHSFKAFLTSFEEELRQGNFMPVLRWKTKFPSHQLACFEKLIGEYMQEVGYALLGKEKPGCSLAVKAMRLEYALYYESKQWAKVNTPLTRIMVDYSSILIDK
jgi:Sulfotransferase family